MQNPAVFLDRDGVLIEDVHRLIEPNQLKVLPGVPQALALLHQANFRLVVVSNQSVVARGLATEAQVVAVSDSLQQYLIKVGGPVLDGWYFCPHHPEAEVVAYRVDCQCRKPRPGLLLRASAELGLDLSRSFMVGDRIIDVLAGARAGCGTVLLQTGRHLEPPGATNEPHDPNIKPDQTCADLAAAATWIIQATTPH
jgi:D-glycero-D-manno-heptose 1,7-bisphosphate phosphatase